MYAFGQCNLFKRETYDELGGHREIGHLVAESHALAALAVEKRIPFRCQCAFKQASMYWYNDFWECWKVRGCRVCAGAVDHACPVHTHTHTHNLSVAQGQLKRVRGRMGKKLPVVNRPIPSPIVATVMSFFMSVQLIQWFIFMGSAKLLCCRLLATSGWVVTQATASARLTRWC